MPNLTRDQLIAAVITSNKIMSATWARRVTKRVHVCPDCRSEAASHGGEWVCNNGHGVVRTITEKRAGKGDMVTMQFRSRIPESTKNFTRAGGHMFNACSADEAADIRRRNGLIGVLKMSEKNTGDLRGMPRTIPIFDVENFKMDGECYDIVD